MSRASKAFFSVSCVTAAAIIGYVHFKQSYDREMLHQGVAENLARQNMGKTQNTFMLQQQIDLTKKLKKEQVEKDNNSSLK